MLKKKNEKITRYVPENTGLVLVATIGVGVQEVLYQVFWNESEYITCAVVGTGLAAILWEYAIKFTLLLY